MDPDLTVERMREEHEKIKARWVGSSHRRKLVDALDGGRAGDLGLVRKAVCVALGSLSVNWHTRVRSVWQFVMFVDVVGMREFLLPPSFLLFWCTGFRGVGKTAGGCW